jgi:putative DNA-invertase from lambdoid prophage Rac
MAMYIYVRVSTDGQSLDPQIMTLKRRYPRARVVLETASGYKTRPVLTHLVRRLKRDDVLVVAALDRLGRRTIEILQLIEGLNHRGVILKSEREGIDYGTPVGRLVTQILVSVAEMERALIVERTKAGIEVARAKGRSIGRPPTLDRRRIRRGIRLIERKGYSVRRAAVTVGVSFSHLAALIRRKRARAAKTGKSRRCSRNLAQRYRVSPSNKRRKTGRTKVS